MINKREEKQLLTINEVADILGVHTETLRRWDNDEKLKAIRIGKLGHRRYNRKEIEKLLNDKLDKSKVRKEIIKI